MIGECDVFYPLQTKISDFYLPTKQPPAPPPPPAEDYDDNTVAGMNAAPPPPNPQPPPPIPIANDSPTPISAPDSGQRPPDGPFKFPTDQQLGISAGTLTNDPNFNVGKHPGEIYVDGGMPSRKRNPNNPNRIWSDQRVNVSENVDFKLNFGRLICPHRAEGSGCIVLNGRGLSVEEDARWYKGYVASTTTLHAINCTTNKSFPERSVAIQTE